MAGRHRGRPVHRASLRTDVSLLSLQARGIWFRALCAADGTTIVFQSDARNLVSGQLDERTDLFVHYPATGETLQVEADSLGTPMTFEGYEPVLSHDGHVVVFQSSSSENVENDTNSAVDIFSSNPRAGGTQRVNLTLSGEQSEGLPYDTYHPSLAPGGQFVAYVSVNNDLVSDDTNEFGDIFLTQVP